MGRHTPHSKKLRAVWVASAQRLYWPLEGVFPAAVSVMKTARTADERKPFFQPATNGSGSGTWHEISALPLTTKKVSFIVAELGDFNEWESDWVAWHECHADAKYVTYGDLSDEDRPYAEEENEDGSWEDDSDTEFLIRCCGEDRPLNKRGFKVEVTPSFGNSFITVRDYVSAVHPALMSLREDIIRSKTVTRSSPRVMGDTDLMVGRGPRHEIWTKDDWIRRHSPPRPMDGLKEAAYRRFIERIGAKTTE